MSMIAIFDPGSMVLVKNQQTKQTKHAGSHTLCHDAEIHFHSSVCDQNNLHTCTAVLTFVGCTALAAGV